MKLKGVTIILILLGMIFLPGATFARVTPEDIIKAQRQAYDAKIKNYSLDHRQKLEKLQGRIALLNKVKTDQLSRAMEVQALILDEYERRVDGKDTEDIKRARYWVTFAHEAVAYQAAKIYIFGLSNENNIKNDAISTINLFQSDLNSTRLKVINSKKILQGVIGNEN